MLETMHFQTIINACQMYKGVFLIEDNPTQNTLADVNRGEFFVKNLQKCIKFYKSY